MVDQEIVNVLREIKLSVQLLIVGVCFLLTPSLVQLLVAIRKAQENKFEREAKDMFEKGDIKKLVDFCHKKLTDRPNHIYALWYLGKGYYALKDYEMAAFPFQRIAEIEPTWHTNYAEIYLDKIAAIAAGDRADPGFPDDSSG